VLASTFPAWRETSEPDMPSVLTIRPGVSLAGLSDTLRYTAATAGTPRLGTGDAGLKINRRGAELRDDTSPRADLRSACGELNYAPTVLQSSSRESSSRESSSRESSSRESSSSL
jgi:hypothetical protein